MNQENWEEARYDILKKYYMELYKEEPTTTRLREYKNGHVKRGGVLRRIDICIEIFERSRKRPIPNRRKHFVVELPELTKRERFFMEALVMKFIMQGRLFPRWVRGIDLYETLDELNENKKEVNPAALQICADNSHQGKTIPEDMSSARVI